MSDDTTREVTDLAEVPAVTPSSGAAGPPPVGRGQAVGRYVVIHQVGAGGMGHVYAAYDPELDRKIALKILQRPATESGASSEDAARMLREAQAMAKLSHPNIVAVYDVGTFDGQVFIAMEFVEGLDLKAWLQRSTDGWRTRVIPFLAAGRGLAAAHAQGIVHRDFKPANVMVRGDGQVRVLDFGLARQVGNDHGAPFDLDAIDVSHSGSGPSLRSSLTRTGIVSGTPAYMAPEQFRADPVDARTDQFSYCVAMYEALYQERPFGRHNFRQLSRAVQRGKVNDPPAGSKVPPRVRRVVLRGLAVDPDDRFPSMEALLEALERAITPIHRRPVTWAAASAVAMAGMVSLVVLTRPSAPERCPDPTPRLAGVWDDARRTEILEAFERTGLVYAADSATRSSTALDRFVASWKAAHRDACEATHVRHEQSASLLDRRMACLEERRAELGAVTELFAAADAQTVEKSVRTAMSLGGLERCADVQRLTAALPPPEDPARAAEVEAIRNELPRVWVLSRSGRPKEALELSATLLERARATEHDPVIAEALGAAGAVRGTHTSPDEGVKDLTDALLLAEAIGHTEVELRVRLQLVAVTGARRSDPEAAHRHAAFVRALQRRLPPTPEERGNLELFEGLTYGGEGKLDEALTQLQEARRHKEAALGPDHPDIAVILVNVGSNLARQGQYDEAETTFARAEEIFTRAFGRLHPQVGTSIHNRGLLRMEMGQYDEAHALVDEAREIWAQVLPEGHADIPLGEQSLGLIEIKQGRFDEALVHLRRAVELKVASLGADHLSVGAGRSNVAEALIALGRFDEALVEAEAAESLIAKAGGPDHRSLGAVRVNRGDALLGLDRPAEALEALRGAREIYETGGGGDPIELAFLDLATGQALLRLGRRDEAAEHAQAALTGFQTRPAANGRALAQASALVAQTRP